MRRYISLLLFIGLAFPVFGQSFNSLQKKLIVENNIRESLQETLSDVIDTDEYVIQVNVDMHEEKEIQRMDLKLILQEGIASELIENIRQLTITASKFDRDRGDKLTIMTASLNKERRDQRSAEQIMLKNIAEKIDLLEQKRVTENTDWRDDIQQYRSEETARRDEDRSFFQGQLAQMEDVEKQSKVDSSRFALLDNELQSLEKMLLQAMLQDSIDAQQETQAKIEVELATREKEKASRDSLIEEKIAALEGVQTELDALQAESQDSSQLMLIALGVVLLIIIYSLNKSNIIIPTQYKIVLILGIVIVVIVGFKLFRSENIYGKPILPDVAAGTYVAEKSKMIGYYKMASKDKLVIYNKTNNDTGSDIWYYNYERIGMDAMNRRGWEVWTREGGELTIKSESKDFVFFYPKIPKTKSGSFNESYDYFEGKVGSISDWRLSLNGFYWYKSNSNSYSKLIIKFKDEGYPIWLDKEL